MEVGQIFEKSAKAALFAWQQDESGHEDLVSDLWVWYLESPATQRKITRSDEFLARRLVYKAALQILVSQALAADTFNGRNLYSSDSVKDALKGKSNNRYLLEILPRALEALANQNEEYAEAIRSRYEDGVVPKLNAPKQKLKWAVKSLTEHVNIITITAGVDADGNVSEGPGSRNAVYPELRRAKGGGHSDPTGNMAIMLLENPTQDGISLRDEYLHEEPLPQFLAGRGYAQPD